MSLNKKPVSLYTPQLEHDSCGVGAVVTLNGKENHKNVIDALDMLKNMEHRGATGSDAKTGDGAGILTGIPDLLFRSELNNSSSFLPAKGSYGVGMFFYPMSGEIIDQCGHITYQCCSELGFTIIHTRPVPVNSQVPGPEAKKVEPYIEQIFVTHKEGIQGNELERKLFVLRNYIIHKIRQEVTGENGAFYIVSFSSKTIIYKGQLKTDQVELFYTDLKNPNYKTSIAVVHSRFSTNTFPNWKLAQPFRFVAHNGEINTIRGNVNKMKSKEALMSSSYFTQDELKKILPVVDPSDSDSSNLDGMVELLTLAGRPLPHVMMMLIPEVWQYNREMHPQLKAFYKYHAALIEPWDGPAALIFTDGDQVGATLDRNGLRPLRYSITKDNRLIMSSEAGAFPIDPGKIIKRGRLKPGNMILADIRKGKIYENDEIKELIYKDKPYFQWIKDHRIKLRLIDPPRGSQNFSSSKEYKQWLRPFGLNKEDIKLVIKPMAALGKEPTGSMGADIPLAVLSEKPQHLANYFKQFFAQVSNPPIDPIREKLVMSLFTRLGESLNLLEESAAHTKQIHISQPVLSDDDFNKLFILNDYPAARIEAVFPVNKEGTLKAELDRLCVEAEELVNKGFKILIISNRKISKNFAAIPSLLAIGAIHHHLIERCIRTKAGLVIEAGDCWEVHHFATIIGYGASAVYPFMAYRTIYELHKANQLGNGYNLNGYTQNYIKSVGDGLLKIMSKMGISTLQSYQGSQIFECIGLGQEVIQRCFKGTISRIEGINMEDIEKEYRQRHIAAFSTTEEILEPGGFYSWRRTGETHLLSPEIIHLLQKSTKLNEYKLFKTYSKKIRDKERLINIRDLLDFRKRQSIEIDEVEPVENILKRFTTGAMSFGSLSHEAHSTLAIAMNRIGGKSNSGEGGEDDARYLLKENGDSERSAIKQVASGRFGVTSYYLTNADELQIKIAQGAKPGEGGQLPGEKVDEWIARVRHSTPGVTLISPPPHHDIYSIEDLKQLIFDLKNANPEARVNVKLVSEAGVGTIAAGVAKAKADVIMISGADGGTGASPLTSIRHAGLPWEMGLAEAHQTLVKNNLRKKIVLQTDGKLMTGYDMAIATLLGAEEWSLSTAALIVEGCVMMRKCHLNTCPVGVATQNPDLRKLFTGNPDHVVNLFTFLAQELREIMAQLGFRSVNEMVGQSQLLKIKSDISHWKLKNLDLSPVLYKEKVSDFIGIYHQINQDHQLGEVLDHKLIEAFIKNSKEKVKYNIKNTDRSVGAMLSHEISKKYGKKGLPEDTYHVTFSGSAGQSFGAFLASGITFNLFGEANDYVGKGLSGGKLIIQPFPLSGYKADENIIVGNVTLYGATGGKVFINGLAGERFCVRNSGAEAVVEGIGDHGCEYMTGGKLLVIGEVGKNFGAGMSGGFAFVYDPYGTFPSRCNTEMITPESPDPDDLVWIKRMLENHHEYTLSTKAGEILKRWVQVKKHFIKIFPDDLKKVMENNQVKTEKQVNYGKTQ